MAGAFTVKEIARQSGLSEATVDRVLHRRGGVRPRTADEVHQAIADLERQRARRRVSGRTYLLDVVMQAPRRFTEAVRAALEAELPSLYPPAVSARFHLTESGAPDALVPVLDRLSSRRSDGVVLKAPDVPEVVRAARQLVGAGVPLVTLVTDVPASGRSAYVGVDNRAAGATAAYLLGRWLGERPGRVLVTVSSGWFRGEEDRDAGFRSAMRRLHPERPVVEVSESQGLDEAVSALVGAELDRDPAVVGVYSVGGGNVATVEAFAARGLPPPVLIGHDLDGDNLRLLADGRVAAVLHHDLRADLRLACQLLLHARGARPGELHAPPSAVQVITPFNLPPALLA